MNRWSARSTWSGLLAMSALILVGGCSQAETVQATQSIPNPEQATRSAAPVVSAAPDLTMADIRAAFDLLDEPAAATVRLIERLEVEGEVLSRHETVTSDPASGITHVDVDHSEPSQVTLDAAVGDPENTQTASDAIRLGVALAGAGVVPQSYVTENNVGWILWGPLRESTVAKMRALGSIDDSTEMDAVIKVFQSSTAPLDKWVRIELDVGNPVQFPGHGAALTPPNINEMLAESWLSPGIEIEDLRLIDQYLEGEAVVVKIAHNLTTTLLVELDKDMRIRAIEQDLSDQGQDVALVWRRIEISWDIDRSLLQLPAKENRFTAIDMFAAMGLGPECVPEGITTVAELEAIPVLTDVLTQTCIDQTPIWGLQASTADNFAKVESGLDGS